MKGAFDCDTAIDSTSGIFEVEFGISADGFPVARVKDFAFAMLRGRDSRHHLATGWNTAQPLEQWRRSDFYGLSGELTDEAAFRSRVFEQAEHCQEREALGRVELPARSQTLWGPSQTTTRYADGVVGYSTASHGGFYLSAERNRIVHLLLRAEGGW
jgi:hypothetical protein